jgi:cytochrome b involved in lipid metabolism
MFCIVLAVTGVADHFDPGSMDLSTGVSASTALESSYTSVTASTTGATSYTLAQVAQHANAQSCWTAINGGVYDVTSWINEHPGGPERILNICGTDGSTAFNQQHGGQRQPANELATFEIGTLAN